MFKGKAHVLKKKIIKEADSLKKLIKKGLS